MLRIWLGAIKARTFQVKAETTSLTLTHPIVPGYCSCWKGKIRAVTVWRVNECWGTLKSMIIWLLHTTHWIHVLAILMQSLLGEEKKYPSGCICTVTGLLEKVKGPLVLINAKSIPGGCEEQQEFEAHPEYMWSMHGSENLQAGGEGSEAGEYFTILWFLIQKLLSRRSSWQERYALTEYRFFFFHSRFSTATPNLLKVKTGFVFGSKVEALDKLRIWLN